jgi:hypothetical protein
VILAGANLLPTINPTENSSLQQHLEKIDLFSVACTNQ